MNRIGGNMGDSIYIFDPESTQLDPEMKIRPKADHIVQIEMEDVNNFTIYLFPDKEVRTFEDFIAMEANLINYVRNWILKNDKTVAIRDSWWEAEDLCRHGMAVMANYKLADIDIRKRVAYRVRAPR